MNNEPVAWTHNAFCSKCHRILSQCCCTPAKTLTDEEIVSCIDESEPDTTDMIRFARAILRKASE
jgi:hypothetical protein